MRKIINGGIAHQKVVEFINSFTKIRHLPSSANLEITRRCNFRCVHCYLQTALKKDELKYSEICSAIDQLADLGVIFITISGGEPFLRPDCIDIIKYARWRGFVVKINTNASLLTEDIIEQVTELGVIPYVISLYGMSGETYKKITGSAENFNKVRRAIDLLIQMQRRKKVKMVSIKAMLFRQNFFELAQFAQFFKDSQVEHKICWEYHPCLDKNTIPLKNSLTLSQVKHLSKVYPNWFANTIPSKPKGSFLFCSHGGRTLISISANGKVAPCALFPNRANIKNAPLREIYKHDPFFVRFRKLHWDDVPKCRDCDVVEYCHPCPAEFFLFTGKLAVSPTPKEICKHRRGRIKKFLYEKILNLAKK